MTSETWSGVSNGRFFSATAVLLGADEQTSAVSFLATFPEMVWEASLGIYLIAKGFKASAGILGEPRQAQVDAGSPAPAMAAS
jgi:hypothetical protein